MNRNLVLSAVLMTGLAMASPLSAQIKKLKTVKNDMTRNIDKDVAKSKYDIDQVMENPETSNMAAAWGWKGIIYSEIALLSDTAELKKTLDPNKQSSLVAGQSFIKFFTYPEADQEEMETKENVNLYVPNAILLAFYDGEDALRANKGLNVVKSYMDVVIQLMPYDVDKLAISRSVTVEKAYYDIWLAAYLDSNVEQELVYLEKLAAIKNYYKSAIYIRLSQIYLDKGNYDMALKYLKDGKEKIPQEATKFLEQEINIELSRNNQEVMISKFNEAISNDPNVSGYYFSRGVTYHQLKLKELENQEKEYKANLTPKPSKYYFKQAMLDYQKALELDPANFDAMNNLAVLMFDSANYTYKQMTRVAGQYDRLKALSMDLYKQALQQFEKLKETGYLKDEDLINMLIDMKSCAAKTNNQEKKKEIEQMIANEKRKLEEKNKG